MLRALWISLAVAMASLALAGSAHADRLAMNIATIKMRMTSAEVVERLGQPLGRKRSGKAVVWRYRDRLSVYVRRKRPGGPRRVVGVRTRSPNDRVKSLDGLRVGSSARRIRGRQMGGRCFTARVADPGGTLRAGRYCYWPVYVSVEEDETFGKPDLQAKFPILLFRITRGRIAAITLQVQPRRHPVK